MLRADLVREIVAHAQRGEGAKRIARELRIDRKTVKHWLRLEAWQPRIIKGDHHGDRCFSQIYRAARTRGGLERRGAVPGTGGVWFSYQRVQRFLKPDRAQRKWSEVGHGAV